MSGEAERPAPDHPAPDGLALDRPAPDRPAGASPAFGSAGDDRSASISPRHVDRPGDGRAGDGDGPGFFLTFEGGEGAGKTTQATLLAGRLRATGRTVVRTREPGGTAGAEAIRDLLVSGEASRWDALSELLLFAAARHDHLRRVIEPALAADHIVICDRFIDSTRVYQGLADGLGLTLIDRLHDEILKARRPDLTIVLDLPVELGLARSGRLHDEARFERRGIAFHERVRAGFAQLAGAEPQRLVRIDARDDVDAVAARVAAIVTERMTPQ